MSSRVYTTQLTVPAGTPISAPLTAPVVLDDIILDTVQIIIPNGHSNLTGIAVISQGLPVVPFTPGTFISGNNESPIFPYGAEVTENGLTVAGYNNDIYPHTFYFRWAMHDQDVTPVTIESPQANTAPAPADVAAVQQLTGVGA